MKNRSYGDHAACEVLDPISIRLSQARKIQLAGRGGKRRSGWLVVSWVSRASSSHFGVRILSTRGVGAHEHSSGHVARFWQPGYPTRTATPSQLFVPATKVFEWFVRDHLAPARF